MRFRPLPTPHRGRRPSFRPYLEALESRTVPYAATGNAWPHPQLVTISFVPDGTNLGGPSSSLISTFNGWFGSATAWQNAILKAAQTWAAQTNINFSVVSDNGTGSGGGNYQQGDPGMGDIRIGGFNFNDTSLLALADMPPPVNNYSAAGDFELNTGQPFNINGLDYDLYSVALHEIGHSLGLGHSTDYYAAMYPYYTGVLPGLDSDDIAGIQSVYSHGAGRSPDAFDAVASNATTATASDITSQINTTSLTALVTGLDVTTSSDVDYYKFTAPANSSTSATVTVQSSGLSLLAPSLKIYNAAGTLLTSATGSGDFGSTLSKTFSITPGQTYYVRVAGANTTVFGTGAYALTLKLGTTAAPAVPLPNTATPIGNPISGGGGVADQTDFHGHWTRQLFHHHGHGGDDDVPFADTEETGAGGDAGHGETGAVMTASATGTAAQAQSLAPFGRTEFGSPGRNLGGLTTTDGETGPEKTSADLGLVAAAGQGAEAAEAALETWFADPSWGRLLE